MTHLTFNTFFVRFCFTRLSDLYLCASSVTDRQASKGSGERKTREVNRWWTIESIEHDNCSSWYELNLTLFFFFFFIFHISCILIEKMMKTRPSCYLLCKYVYIYVCMNTTPSDWASIRNVIYEGLVFVKGNLLHWLHWSNVTVFQKKEKNEEK